MCYETEKEFAQKFVCEVWEHSQTLSLGILTHIYLYAVYFM